MAAAGRTAVARADRIGEKTMGGAKRIGVVRNKNRHPNRMAVAADQRIT